MVRSVNVELLTENIKEMCIQANHFLAPDMDKAMRQNLACMSPVTAQRRILQERT